MDIYGYDMQIEGGLAEKLWPSTDPYVGGVTECPYINMDYFEVQEEFYFFISKVKVYEFYKKLVKKFL